MRGAGYPVMKQAGSLEERFLAFKADAIEKNTSATEHPNRKLSERTSYPLWSAGERGKKPSSASLMIAKERLSGGNYIMWERKPSTLLVFDAADHLG